MVSALDLKALPLVMAFFSMLMWLAAKNATGRFHFIQQKEAGLAIMLVALALMCSAIAAFVVAKTTVNPLSTSMLRH